MINYVQSCHSMTTGEKGRSLSLVGERRVWGPLKLHLLLNEDDDENNVVRSCRDFPSGGKVVAEVDVVGVVDDAPLITIVDILPALSISDFPLS